MALVIRRLYEGFVLLDEVQDSRTSGDPFLASPLCLLAAIASYIYFFKTLGPRLMEKRKPYNVKTAMIIYNIIQIVINGYVLILGTKAMIQMQSLLCENVDYSNSPLGILCLKICRIFTYLKIFDAGDTLFFLLRKNYHQISFLHLYHHSAMMLAVWVGFRYYSGGTIIWIPIVNSFVHCAMFTYYLLTAMDSSWKHSIFIKKSLTRLQLIQFTFFVFVYGKIAVWPTCQLPRFLSFLFTVQNFFMMFLFGDFYIKNYIKKPKKNI